MGLIKRDGYTIKGIDFPSAYAKVLAFTAEPKQTDDLENDYVYVSMGISNIRENLDSYTNALDVVRFRMPYNRSEDNIFNQIYTKAKEEYFQGWEDDIVEETSE